MRAHNALGCDVVDGAVTTWRAAPPVLGSRFSFRSRALRPGLTYAAPPALVFFGQVSDGRYLSRRRGYEGVLVHG
jgi:hypothetical protein